MSEPQPLGTATCHDELVDLLVARKEALGLSNAFIDQYWGYASGMTDKYLGPAREKTLGRQSLDDLCMVLGVSLVVVVDMNKLQRMDQQWEERKPGYAHSPRVSKKSVKRARPIVWQETGRLGGMVTAHMRTPAQRSQSARHAARSRWKKAGKSKVRCARKRARQSRRNVRPQISPTEGSRAAL